jgi:archaemetzincin
VLCNLFACQSKEIANNEQAKTKTQYVAIQPFTNTSSEKIAVARKAIENFYGFPTIVLMPTQAPTTAFIHLKSPRYRADSLLVYLWKKCPDSISYIGR